MVIIRKERKKGRKEGGKEREKKKITSVDEGVEKLNPYVYLIECQMIYYEKQYGHFSNNKKKFTILPSTNKDKNLLKRKNKSTQKTGLCLLMTSLFMIVLNWK